MSTPHIHLFWPSTDGPPHATLDIGRGPSNPPLPVRQVAGRYVVYAPRDVPPTSPTLPHHVRVVHRAKGREYTEDCYRGADNDRYVFATYPIVEWAR